MQQNNTSWMFQTDKLNDMATWNNAFSAEECKQIIELGEKTNFQIATVAGDNAAPIEDLSYRNTKINWIYPVPETEFIFRRITDVVTNMNSLYFNFDLLGMIEGLQFTKYEAPSGFYGMHADRAPNSRIRKLSMTVQLSDPDTYEGGELAVRIGAQDVIAEKEIGKMVCFPSYILHEVKPVTKGTRYSLVAWFTGPAFR